MVVKIADPLLMREINKYHVLETIRSHGEISRVEICERTQLSGTTVSAITGALIEEGLIHAIHTGHHGEVQRGRPRVLLGLVPDAAYVLGIKISDSKTTVTLVDFRGELVATSELPIRMARQPGDVIADIIEDALNDCVAKSGIDRSRLRGIGVGVPGLVDPRTGRSYSSHVFGEGEVPIATLLHKRTGLPVKLEKPANLLALAESWFGFAQSESIFAVVALDHTASLSLWMDAGLHRGAATLGPTFGHTKVGEAGVPCDCGQVDCLNAYVGLAAMRREATARLGSAFTETPLARSDLMTALAKAGEAGNAAAQSIIDEQGKRIGVATAHLVNLVNPGKIIFAFESELYCERVAPALKAAVAANSFRAHLAATQLVFHALDDQLWARGAAALMLRDIYSAPWTSAYQEEKQ